MGFLDNLGFGSMFRAASALIFFHIIVAPRHVNDLGWKGTLQWFGCTSAVCLISYIIANAIPFFDSLTSLIGGFCVPFMNLMIPVMIYMRTKHLTGQKIQMWEWVLNIAIILFAVLVAITSTIFNIEEIIQSWSTYGAPFACHCQDIWNTC